MVCTLDYIAQYEKLFKLCAFFLFFFFAKIENPVSYLPSGAPSTLALQNYLCFS